MQNWSNLDKIFIGTAKGMETLNYGYVTKEWIMENNPLYIERSIIKPIGLLNEMGSLVEFETIRYYRDGRVERRLDYTTNPGMVDNTTILSPFGHKMMMDKIFGNEVLIDDRCDCCNNE